MKYLILFLILKSIYAQQYQVPQTQSTYNPYQSNSYYTFSDLYPNGYNYYNYYSTPINPVYPGYTYTTASPYYNTYMTGYAGYNAAYPWFNWLYPFNYNGNLNAGQQQVFGRKKRSVLLSKL
uniref:Uncharacterized protein n=1 Tax=Megaselia scalaris TaxID=36166 RepID=T1GIH9_MEGSC